MCVCVCDRQTDRDRDRERDRLYTERLKMSSKTLTLTHAQRGDTNIIALNAYIAIISARTACPYLQIKIGVFEE